MASPSTDRRPPPLLGKGRFVVVDHLGDGGTSGVYLSWDQQAHQWVAVKALLHQHLADQEMRQRFRAEADTMARLNHRHIVKLLHHELEATPPFLVMELARCGSVMGWVKKNGPMPASLAVDVLVQMCDALQVAHDHGVVHRDVKPHNFLMDDHGLCKLTDFGIARVDENTSMTATGSQIGTFSFMAPEQRSSSKDVDHRADIYALGASLYTILVARTSAELFIAEDDESILAAVPAPFRRVILGACQYRPEDRYASMLDLQGELFSALSRIPSQDGDYPPLVEAAAPLPAGPPRWLDPDVVFDDLTRSLGLDLDNPTYVPSPAVKSATPAYTMSRPSGGGSLDYLAPAERAKEEARAAQQEARRLVPDHVEVPAAASPSSDGRWLEGAVYLIMASVVLVVLLVGGSGLWVGMGRSATTSASEQFTIILQSESSVVYDLGGDRSFEEIYDRYERARGPEKVAAAVAFADALERVSTSRTNLDPVVAQRVDRILSARDAYAAAFEDWRGRASSFPGSIAVSLGLVSGPLG